MEPAVQINKSGEYRLINIKARLCMSLEGDQQIELKLIFLSYQKDPYYTSMYYEDTPESASHLKELLHQVGQKNVTDSFYSIPSYFKKCVFKPLNVLVTLTEQGCLLAF